MDLDLDLDLELTSKESRRKLSRVEIVCHDDDLFGESPEAANNQL